MTVYRFKPSTLLAPVTIRRHVWETPLERLASPPTSVESDISVPVQPVGFPAALRSLARRLLPDGLKRLIKQAIR